MRGSRDRSHRIRSLRPSVESMEGRSLLSAGGGGAMPFRSAMVALLARRSLSLRGNLAGTITPSTTDGQNYLVTVTLQGYSGNPRLEFVTVTATAATTAGRLGSLGRVNATYPGLTVEISSAEGTGTAIGTLHLNRSRSASRIPFRLNARLVSGTGVLADASGNLNLQGNFNALLGSQLRAQLRGNLRAPA